MRKPDIFDKLMSLPVLNIFESFYKKGSLSRVGVLFFESIRLGLILSF